MKRLLFIFNPTAGKGSIKGRLPGVLDALTKEGYLVTAYPTQSKGDAARCAAELGGQFDRVVCCGGDGTLSETISGLEQLDAPPPLGYLPAGSTNDFAHNLNLPKGLVKAARAAASGPVRACDVGRFNGRTFIYVAAFGAFTDVSYDTPQEFKNLFGHLAYVLQGMTRLGSIHSYPLQVACEDRELDGEFIYGMVSNTVSVGGFKSPLADGVRLDDGLFEVLLIRQPKNLAETQSILMALMQQKLEEGGPVVSFRASKVRFVCEEPLPWTLDGEYGGDPQTAEIENRRQAVALVWGK